MQATLDRQTFRGVSCRHCGQPSRVRPTIAEREQALKQSEPGVPQLWFSGVFSHRCRLCGGEAIYALEHIIDFEEESAG